MKKLSWDDIEKIANELADKIKASGFAPDYLVGITTGGLIPLYFLAKRLSNTANILTVSANSYTKDEKKDLKISYLPEVDLSDKNVLLIDEIAGTGGTFKEVSDIMIGKYKVRELKTAAFAVLKDSQFHPNFYALEEDSDWIVFPWDKYEFPEYF